MGEARIEELLPEVRWIADGLLRDAVIAIWLEMLKESRWEDPSHCPKHPVDAPTLPLTEHVRSVTRQAVAVADIVADQYRLTIDKDVLVAGALLHDVSKLVEYEPGADGQGSKKSRLGELFQHGAYGAFKAWSHALPAEVIHIVLSHTDQSRHPPRSLESIIVHYVDYCDSDVLLHLAGKPLFAR